MTYFVVKGRQVLHTSVLKLPRIMEMVDSMYHSYVRRFSLCGMYFMHSALFQSVLLRIQVIRFGCFDNFPVVLNCKCPNVYLLLFVVHLTAMINFAVWNLTKWARILSPTVLGSFAKKLLVAVMCWCIF